MIQSNNNVLAVRFTCANTVDVGDIVEITTDNTVAAISAASAKIVGCVVSHAYGATECVVATRFRERRDDRVAAENFAACAPFYFGADNKVYLWETGTDKPEVIGGLVIKAGDADATVETLEF